MKIKTDGAPNASQIDLNQTQQSREVSSTSAPGPSSAGSITGDSITISGLSDLVQQAVNSGADARTARVEQLRQLVQSNQYNVDPEAVSRALINAHLAIA